jgi:hypothetical protein
MEEGKGRRTEEGSDGVVEYWSDGADGWKDGRMGGWSSRIPPLTTDTGTDRFRNSLPPEFCLLGVME